MKFINQEEFFANYHPQLNTLFPNSPYKGCLFDPSLLFNISGFIRTHQLWSVKKIETKVSEETNEVKITYQANPGLDPLSNTIGYFITEVSTKGDNLITVLLESPTFNK